MMVTPLATFQDFTNAIEKPLAVIFVKSSDKPSEPRIMEYLETLTTTEPYSTASYHTCPALPEIDEQHDVVVLPALLIFGSKKLLEELHDFSNLSKITVIVKKHLDTSNISLSNKLMKLVNSSQVMLFMKGTKDAPRCHFSKDMVVILNREGITFNTFDILSNEEVRQGLKEYSNWPTYPQLYVRGELIGGLDIVKSMSAGGSLRENLEITK